MVWVVMRSVVLGLGVCSGVCAWWWWYGAKTAFIVLFSLFPSQSINRNAYCGERHVLCCAVLCVRAGWLCCTIHVHFFMYVCTYLEACMHEYSSDVCTRNTIMGALQ
jgi:hypothetical protein